MDPNSTTTTKTTTTTTTAITATPRPISPHVSPNPNPFLYPVSSSGRGFIPRGIRPPFATDSPSIPYTHGVRAHFDYINQLSRQHYPHQHQHQLQHHQLGPTASPPIKVLPFSPQYPNHPKAVPRAAVSDTNGYKDTSARERSRDDPCYVIRGRKVRITGDASLYALCRSWLKNGAHEENQPQHKDVMKALPKPLSVSTVADYMSSNKEEKDDDEHEENEESVEDLSPSDLLKRHVNRAKKVRARLRQERLHRIMRYRGRLRLLLPPPFEQLKNDTAAGN